MARNVEIKARVPGLDAIREKARSRASSAAEFLQQTDMFFEVPQGRLKVREFADGTGELIAYHRPNDRGPKESVYSRSPCQNAKALSQTLGKVLAVRGAVVKRREVIMLGRTRVHLDEVEGLGSFVELEVVLRECESVECGRLEADELLRVLDIPRHALIAEAYIDLLDRERSPKGSAKVASV
jgi:predicted adenylyl cyclase CyaB